MGSAYMGTLTLLVCLRGSELVLNGTQEAGDLLSVENVSCLHEHTFVHMSLTSYLGCPL